MSLLERCTLGIDIGGTHLRMGLVRADGSVLCCEKAPTASLSFGDPTAALGDAIRDYISRNGSEKQIQGIVIGFPATVDRARERVLNAPHVQGFDGVPVGQLLSARLGLPVWIERDVNLLLLSDLRVLGMDALDVVACYVGTGIGNAIYLNGRLLYGHNGVAGELGHIPYGDAAHTCGCGNAGCAEALAGGLYLAQLCRTVFTDTPIGELFLRHATHPLLVQYVERLGRVIATEINLLDPAVLLLGGGVLAMRNFPRAQLEQCIFAHTRAPYPRNALRICYSAAESGVLGAGLLAWQYCNAAQGK